MQIIHKESQSGRFKPHYNTATGVYYHEKKDYLNDLKKKGLEPYKPGAAEKVNTRKEYKPSDTARGLINTIKSSTGKDGKVRLGGVAIDAMKRHGVVFTDTNKRDNSGRDHRQGGFK